jgi:hypothetical protein
VTGRVNPGRQHNTGGTVAIVIRRTGPNRR